MFCFIAVACTTIRHNAIKAKNIRLNYTELQHSGDRMIALQCIFLEKLSGLQEVCRNLISWRRKHRLGMSYMGSSVGHSD